MAKFKFPKRSNAARKFAMNKRQMKYSYKTALGANKGKTARALSRHAAMSTFAQNYGSATSKNEREIGRLQGYLQATQQVRPENNNSNPDKKPNSGSSNILGWIN